MPERRRQRIGASVRPEIFRRAAARTEDDPPRKKAFGPRRALRLRDKTVRFPPQGTDAHARRDPYSLFGETETEQIGHGGSLSARRINAPAPVGDKQSAQVFEKSEHILPAVQGERTGKHPPRIPALMKIVVRGHMQIGNVALPVARRGQFSARALSPFEDQNVFSAFQRRRAEQSRSASADDNRAVSIHNDFIVTLSTYKVKFISQTIEFFFVCLLTFSKIYITIYIEQFQKGDTRKIRPKKGRMPGRWNDD